MVAELRKKYKLTKDEIAFIGGNRVRHECHSIAVREGQTLVIRSM